ncbi:MAG: tRNA-dihydrouridine synthase family protein, partial [Desulfobulbaceae bacterium]|nr:tRNA-dihydrouridine synthase family protein [Desulfobulbaceae bacterium]
MTNDQSLLRIGNLPVSPPLLLAPMAGLTHTALRTLLVELGGVGLLSTEMLSARTLPHENPEISPFLKRSAVERPLSYQLLVGEVAEVAPAVHALHRQGADVIDLNLGCPAPNVRRRGGGSRLSEQPEMVRLVVAEARRRTELPLTAKIRLGEELDAPRLRDFCQMLEAEGVDMISVHARLRGEPFCRKPRWEWVGKVKSWVKVPVIANGGIFSVEDASRCLELSGADGLMIGRAAPTKPWLFAEIGRELYGAAIAMPEVNLPAIYFRFSALLAERFAPERRLGRFKEFTHYYAKNYAFGHHLGRRC